MPHEIEAIETKAFDWEVKEFDDSGKLSMYVAAFKNIDRGGDVIEPGAFANTDEFVRSGWLGVNHNMHAVPIGFPLSAVQDSKGLLCEFQFHSTPEAQAARTTILERMRAKKAVSGSIGYRVRPGGSKKDTLDGKSIRRLSKLDIFEASYVNCPMNPLASVISAKSLDGDGPKLIGIDQLKDLLELLEKQGRTVSRTNLNKLKDMHGKLSDATAMLSDFINEHNPDVEPPDDLEDGPLVGGGGRVKEGKVARLKLLRLRALRGRAKAASLPRE